MAIMHRPSRRPLNLSIHPTVQRRATLHAFTLLLSIGEFVEETLKKELRAVGIDPLLPLSEDEERRYELLLQRRSRRRNQTSGQ